MYWTKLFIPTLKDTPQEAESASHQLMLRSGLIRMLMSGVYTYLPLGLKVLNNIKNIIRQEMNATGANELLLPALQPLELWLASGRDQDMGEVMIRFTDRRKRNICLGPTHEEVITDLVKNNVSSYRQLPLVLYQIQTKFRDEIRPRFGLVRGCEFIMKDAYSFDKDEEGLKNNYNIMYDAYHRIFKRLGLDFLCIEADPGVMGGNLSHEFMVPAEIGEDIVCSCQGCKFTRTFSEEKDITCPKCKTGMKKVNAIEVGHIFQLGTKYSVSLGANFVDQTGKSLPIIMGCYGIGVSRLISGIIEQNHDAEGIIWPKEITPFQVIIMPLDVTDQKIMDKAKSIYDALEKKGIEPFLDDRDERAGVKFKDADLIGMPFQIIIGKEFLKNNNLELKVRRTKEKIIASFEEIVKRIVDNG
ncbi:MAG: proline--tRNA ligase [Candidatus Omnitrophota bacterium]|nr:proline--tRNA ligase [Candidatus Omnitrophota bacterium]MBU1929611.1 proline--tRNA ligase [Candidatus Omnitrophota bacterium]MBU2034804.1 proline--tRNA ligase [Candidatus Omnitrophota bacterium]MBU2258546.1 proline--tRNA ligase [Candidatus Omnitrophota bacterium]